MNCFFINICNLLMNIIRLDLKIRPKKRLRLRISRIRNSALVNTGAGNKFFGYCSLNFGL